MEILCFWIIFSLLSWAYLSVFQILRFCDTGKSFRSYFALCQGPLAPPLDRKFGFSDFFSFSFRATVISIQNLTLLRYQEMLLTIFRPVSRAPGFALGHKFWVFHFSLQFYGFTYRFAKFTLLPY